MSIFQPWELVSGGPVIYRPSAASFAYEMMRHSIAMEVEHDADVLWRLLLKTEWARERTVEELEVCCRYWFTEGYSEHVHRRASELRITPK